MGNCLVTKLKESVNNDNLVKMDELIVEGTFVSELLKLRSNGDVGTITLDGEGYLEKNGVQSKEFNFSDDYITVPAGKYKLRITNKYGITAYEGAQNFDLSNLQYMSNIRTLTSQNTKGDINYIPAGMATMAVDMNNNNYGEIKESTGWLTYPKQNFTWNEYKGFTGEIKYLAKIPTIITIAIAYTSMTGSIEDMVARFVTEGRTEGDIVLDIAGLNVTIGGIIYNYQYNNCRLIWSNSGATWYYQDATNAQIQDPTDVGRKVYAHNCTAEQISAWEANNNIVITV